MTVRILIGDARAQMAAMPSKSVHMVVTSPPYYGLRDYGVAGQMGLEETPEAFVASLVELFREVRRVLRDDGTAWVNLGDSYAGTGRGGYAGGAGTLEGSTDGQDGSRQARERVARGKGEIGVTAKREAVSGRKNPPTRFDADAGGRIHTSGVPAPAGFKVKDLMGMPWRVAFALQADGWYLRQDIIWAKPNPMPESVTDRCTKAHEYIFLLSKRPQYFYDAVAIKERASENTNPRVPGNKSHRGVDAFAAGDEHHRTKSGLVDYSNRKTAERDGMVRANKSFEESASAQVLETRNKRSVWMIGSEAFSEAHFATFPTALVEPCILAGTSERGCCVKCSAPWERIEGRVDTGRRQKIADGWDTGEGGHGTIHRAGRPAGQPDVPVVETVTLGWWPSCSCEGLGDLPAYPPRPPRGGDLVEWRRECAVVDYARKRMCDREVHRLTTAAIVLDPFGGAGTTGLVADRLQRDAVLVELNPEYAAMARRRINGDAPLFSMEAAQ